MNKAKNLDRQATKDPDRHCDRRAEQPACTVSAFEKFSQRGTTPSKSEFAAQGWQRGKPVCRTAAVAVRAKEMAEELAAELQSECDS